MIEVSKKEFMAWKEAYPRELVSDVCHMSTPPTGLYHDFSLGEGWDAVVASVTITEGYPKGEEHYPYCWSPNIYRIDERFLLD